MIDMQKIEYIQSSFPINRKTSPINQFTTSGSCFLINQLQSPNFPYPQSSAVFFLLPLLRTLHHRRCFPHFEISLFTHEVASSPSSFLQHHQYHVYECTPGFCRLEVSNRYFYVSPSKQALWRHFQAPSVWDHCFSSLILYLLQTCHCINLIPIDVSACHTFSRQISNRNNTCFYPISLSPSKASGQLMARRFQWLYVICAHASTPPPPPRPQKKPRSFLLRFHTARLVHIVPDASDHSQGTVGGGSLAPRPAASRPGAVSARPAWPGESANPSLGSNATSYSSRLPAPGTNTNPGRVDDLLLGVGSQFDGCYSRGSTQESTRRS